jgi:hypothetical protein
MGIVLSKLPSPLTNGVVGDGNTTFEQEFLHVAGVQVTREESQTPWRTIAAGKQECLECSVLAGGGMPGYLSCGSMHP